MSSTWQWDAALCTEKLLKKSSLQQMWTPVKLNSGKSYPYGFGWNISNANGHALCGTRVETRVFSSSSR
jgi:hypothetical protein